MDDLDERVAADAREHFPVGLLAPWQGRVAVELGPDWHAHMLPVFPREVGAPPVSVIWTLRRKGEADAMHDPPRYEFLLTGVDRDRLIDAAQNFERAYI